MKKHQLVVGFLSAALLVFGSTAPAQAAGSLTIWVLSGEEAAYKAASSAWADKNNVSLTILAKCGLGDCGLSKAGPAGIGPDLFTATHDNTGAMVKSGLLSSLSATINSGAYPKAAVEGVTSKYGVWGVPISISSLALATNQALVPSGAPKDWAELESTSTKLITSGKASVGISAHLDGYNLQAIFESLGGYVFANKNGKYTSTRSNGLYSKELAKNASLMDKWLEAKIFDKDNNWGVAKFVDGKAPYAIVGPWDIAGLDKAKIKYEISAIPSVKGGSARAFSGVTAMFMNRYAKNRILAKQYLTEVVQTKEFGKAISEANDSYPANIAAAATVSKTSYSAKMGAYASICLPTPNVAEMNSVWTYWNGAFAEWGTGKSKFGEAMKAASKNLDIALGS